MNNCVLFHNKKWPIKCKKIDLLLFWLNIKGVWRRVWRYQSGNQNLYMAFQMQHQKQNYPCKYWIYSKTRELRNLRFIQVFAIYCLQFFWNYAGLECGRWWVRASVRSNQRLQVKIGICCFSALLKEKDFLSWNVDNVSEWSDMSTCWLLFQWASTIKIQLALNNNHLLTLLTWWYSYILTINQ